MKYYSILLGHFVFWIAILLVPIFLNFIDEVAMIILGMFENVCLAYCLKYIFQRPRPYEVLVGVKVLDAQGDPSFPSSHVQNCTCFTVITSIIWPFTFLPLLIIVLMLAFSRIYVGAHYPSDVMGGILLGIVFSFLYLVWLYPIAVVIYNLLSISFSLFF